MYEYDDDFYGYINQGSIDSARVVLPALLAILPHPVQSVLDVGCGAGAWLTVWKSLGAEILGLDGDYVRPEQLLISHDEFSAVDLRASFFLNRRFDLAQSLEVAEHLPASSAAGLVDSLCRHSDLVLFSAAPPGQGGENHINEQPYEFWRDLFWEQGYEMHDPIRAALRDNKSVKPWYRYNTFLYVNGLCNPEVREALSGSRVERGRAVADVSPSIYRLRKRLVGLLPVAVSTAIATLKKKL